MKKKIKNIGIFAHVDAGKTSITEHFLYAGGVIKSVGNVDDGSTVSDDLSIEKERGISVKSSYISFEIDDITVNLADTPGHVDFSSEIERSLPVIDVAVLVLSAVEGVQAHTITIWNALHKRNIPVIFFLNKVDRQGADSLFVIEEIKKELTESIIVLNKAINEGQNDCESFTLFTDKNIDESILEVLSEQNDNILEMYLEGKKIDFDLAEQVFIKAVHNRKLFPVLTGSAKFFVGIEDLMHTVLNYLPSSDTEEDAEMSAFAFGLKHEKKGKYTLLKILSGTIKPKDVIRNITKNVEEKVNGIRKRVGAKYIELTELNAGDIGEISGLNKTDIGDVFGDERIDTIEKNSINTPLLTVQIKAENENDHFKLAEALQILSAEDPELDFEWVRDEQELNVKIMGWMQMQILEHILEDRFEIKAKFEPPTVIYKETPSGNGEGFVKYWMPKPCWAIMKFKIEPGERGCGVVYKSNVSVDDIQQKYQNEVERTIPVALKQGIKGWEVTDIIITLIEGEDHQIHSRPGDFVVATPMGIMQGLKEIGTDLIEPIISYKITAPEEMLGKITSDIIQMRGEFDSPDIENGVMVLKGTLPLATSIDYPIKLSSRSGGKAKISTEFHSYKICSDEEGVIRKYKGISPLDTSKYILKARRALQ